MLNYSEGSDGGGHKRCHKLTALRSKVKDNYFRTTSWKHLKIEVGRQLRAVSVQVNQTRGTAPLDTVACLECLKVVTSVAYAGLSG